MSSTRAACVQRIAHRAVHLRDAAQRIAVLRLVLLAAAERAEALVELLAAVALRRAAPSPSRCRSAAPAIPASSQRPAPSARKRGTRWYGMSASVEPASSARRLRRGAHLARMRTQRVHFLGERAAGGRRRHRSSSPRRGRRCRAVLRGAAARARRCASICAVPLLSARPSLYDSVTGCRPARCSASRARHALALVERFAAAEQHDRQVRQRREIARRADRTQLRHHRHDAGVEHRGQRLQRFDADAGMPAHQRVDADAQHRAHHVRRERLADADRVRDDQVVAAVRRCSDRPTSDRAGSSSRTDARRAACRRCCRSRWTRRRSVPRGATCSARKSAARCDGLQRCRRRVRRCAPCATSTSMRSRERAAVEADRVSSRVLLQLRALLALHAQAARAPLRSTSNWSPRRRSLTVTTPRAISSSPRIATKRMPARSAYWNCLASLRGSSCVSTLMPAARSSLRQRQRVAAAARRPSARPAHRPSCRPSPTRPGLAQLEEQPRQRRSRCRRPAASTSCSGWRGCRSGRPSRSSRSAGARRARSRRRCRCSSPGRARSRGSARSATPARRARCSRRSTSRSSATPFVEQRACPRPARRASPAHRRGRVERTCDERHQRVDRGLRRGRSPRPPASRARRRSPRLSSLSSSRSTGRLLLAVGDAEAFEVAAQQLAVVELDGEGADRQLARTCRGSPPGSRRRKRTRQRVLADHVDVALVELAEAAALRALAAVHALDLVAAEREGELVLVLGDVARQRHGEVEAQRQLRACPPSAFSSAPVDWTK